MKLILNFILLIILIVGCSMSNEEKIDQLFGDYDINGMPGAAVMLIKDREIIFEKGYGKADIENNLPVTSESNFRLASVTKQFTAMSILLLIERNQLSLETTLYELFQNFPEFGNKITIKNLLQHTSGLIDYEDLISDTATIQVKDEDVLDLIMATDSTYFDPGIKHQYSNTGYALLALVVEKISGKPFRDFLSDNIFQPLGMDNTVAFEKNINQIKNRVYGYTIMEKIVELTDQSITSAVLGDGGIYSSISDLYKWDQALYTDKLINKKYLDDSWKEGITSNGTKFSYGYGWRLENYNSIKAVYHTGSTIGFRNIFYRMPEKSFSIIILTNRDAGSEFSTLEFAHKIIDLYFRDNR